MSVKKSSGGRFGYFRARGGAVYVVLLSMSFCLLLSSCGEEKYPGQNSITYEVSAVDEPMVINVLGNDDKFLSCAVTIDISNKDDVALLEQKNHWVRDIVIEACRSKTLEELQRDDIMEELGALISQAVSEKFAISSVYKVSFPTFYLN